jgi:hypothetical protein
MASLGESRTVEKVSLFNSPLETGVRALFVLNAAHPKSFDLTQMTWFDHLVVHTGDIGGLESLHPDVPHRSGELLVRRRLIEEGLTLMRRLHLVDVLANEQGIFYQASDEAPAFIELMRSNYAVNLRARAQWLAENVCNLDGERMRRLIREKIGRWNVEFQGEIGPQQLPL